MATTTILTEGEEMTVSGGGAPHVANEAARGVVALSDEKTAAVTAQRVGQMKVVSGSATRREDVQAEVNQANAKG